MGDILRRVTHVITEEQQANRVRLRDAFGAAIAAGKSFAIGLGNCCVIGLAHRMDDAIPSFDNTYGNYDAGSGRYSDNGIYGVNGYEFALLFGGSGAADDVTAAEAMYALDRFVRGESALPYANATRAMAVRFGWIPVDTLTIRERMKFDDDAYNAAVMPEATRQPELV